MNAGQTLVKTMENALMESTIISATVHRGTMVQTATKVMYQHHTVLTFCQFLDHSIVCMPVCL